MNQRLQTLCMCSCQLEDLQSMILLNLMCWIIAKDNGKGSAKFDQFLMETMDNRLLRKLVMFLYAGIVDAHSVCQLSKVPMYANG